MSQETYKNIIEAAYGLFAENGFDATSMSSVSHKAKVSKGGLYHYFKSKEDLLFKVFEEKIVKDSLDIFINPIKLSRENFRQVLFNEGAAYIKEIQKDKRRKKFTLQVSMVLFRTGDLVDRFKPFMEMVFMQIHGIIEKGIEYGFVLSSIDKDLLAQKFFMLLDTIELYAAFDVDFRLEDIWTDFIDNNLLMGA